MTLQPGTRLGPYVIVAPIGSGGMGEASLQRMNMVSCTAISNPENIFVTDDGQIKILDFGLAKTTELDAARTEQVGSVTMTARGTVTTAGTVIGTVGYMSPEQVRGQAVDHRTDIFSLGAILFEMLGHRRAFSGDSAIETLNAILKEDPTGTRPSSVYSLRPILPRSLHRPLASTDGSLTKNLNKTGVRLWTDRFAARC